MKNNLLVLVTFLLLFALNDKAFAANKPKGTSAGGWCGTKSPDEAWEAALQRVIAHQNVATKSCVTSYTIPGVLGWAKDYIDGTVKPATIWDPNYYLNIWVVPGIASSTPGQMILGYAVFPQFTGLQGLPETSTEFTDGFVCRSNYFGTVGSA